MSDHRDITTNLSFRFFLLFVGASDSFLDMAGIGAEVGLRAGAHVPLKAEAF